MATKILKNEGDVKKAVKKILDPYKPDLWYFMPAANGYGSQGIPDFVGTYRGFTFVIETKFGRGTTTDWQQRQLEAVDAAGGMTWLVHNTTIDSFSLAFHTWVQVQRAKHQLGE